jgi:hypothetical protein
MIYFQDYRWRGFTAILAGKTIPLENLEPCLFGNCLSLHLTPDKKTSRPMIE